MTEWFDPGGDFPEVVDRTETVTLKRRGGDSATVAGALKRGVTTQETGAAGGRITAGDVRWHLSVASLSDPPAIGDRLVDADAVVWTVLEVRHEAAGSRWVCLARSLAIVHGLSERIDIERATWTKDAAGAARATWHTERAGVRARIQPRDATVATGEGRRHVEATHIIHVAEPIAVDQDHRVVGPDGRIYHIVGYRNAEQIDEPLELEVVDARGTNDQ